MKTLLSSLGFSVPLFSPGVCALLVTNPTSAWALSRMLRGAGALVEVVSEVEGARRRAATGHPSVVILDMRLPGAWDWVRAERRWPMAAMVEHEATGIRALLQGAAAVVNTTTVEAPELVGVVSRLGSLRDMMGAPPCAVMEEMCQQTGRVLEAVNAAVSQCVPAR